MIFEGSRYRRARMLRVRTASSDVQVAVYDNEPRSKSFTFFQYTTQQDDRFDLLAHKFLGNSELWWLISEANPEILSLGDVPPLTILRIPNVE